MPDHSQPSCANPIPSHLDLQPPEVKDRVVVAMSGGVDSSVAAAILHHQGYDTVGISMKLYADAHDSFSRSCCSPDDLFDARMVAEQLQIPFYVANYQDEFQKRVIDYFVDEYRHGRTPNPCVACNNHLKFDILLKRSLALGSKFLATGHYARISYDGDAPKLLRGRDLNKDQSYFLFGLPRLSLSKIVFPLGDLTKEQVRDHARALNLETAEKAESQEICFVGNGNYKEFVQKKLASETPQPGLIKHIDGRILGEHQGIHSFTVGQRKGLGISFHEPLYVHAIRPKDRTVVVGPKSGLNASSLVAERCNWLSFDAPPGPLFCQAKIRYRGEPVPATVIVGGDPQTAFVTFEKPQRAVTPGQAVVFYNGDEVLGGGWIEEART